MKATCYQFSFKELFQWFKLLVFCCFLHILTNISSSFFFFFFFEFNIHPCETDSYLGLFLSMQKQYQTVLFPLPSLWNYSQIHCRNPFWIPCFCWLMECYTETKKKGGFLSKDIQEQFQTTARKTFYFNLFNTVFVFPLPLKKDTSLFF